MGSWLRVLVVLVLERTQNFTAMLRKRGSYIESGEDLGPQDVRSFKEMLRRKFGSVARGWRAGMCNDVCNEGNKLAFVEFCNAARALGYTGNISLLFKTLDEDGSANISLGELDPDVFFGIGMIFYPPFEFRFGLDPDAVCSLGSSLMLTNRSLIDLGRWTKDEKLYLSARFLFLSQHSTLKTTETWVMNQ